MSWLQIFHAYLRNCKKVIIKVLLQTIKKNMWTLFVYYKLLLKSIFLKYEIQLEYIIYWLHLLPLNWVYINHNETRLCQVIYNFVWNYLSSHKFRYCKHRDLKKVPFETRNLLVQDPDLGLNFEHFLGIPGYDDKFLYTLELCSVKRWTLSELLLILFREMQRSGLCTIDPNDLGNPRIKYKEL